MYKCTFQSDVGAYTVTRLYMHSIRARRGAAIVQTTSKSVRPTQRGHTSRNLTTSRFVRILNQACYMTPLRRHGLRAHERLDGPALAWRCYPHAHRRCYPHAPRRCPPQQASLPLHPRFCPLLNRVDHVSRLQAHRSTAACAQSGKVRLAPAQPVHQAEDRSSTFIAASLVIDMTASFIAGRRSLTASSLNMFPRTSSI